MDTKFSNRCKQNPPNAPHLISEHLSLDQPVVGVQLLQRVLSNIQHIYIHCLEDISINIIVLKWKTVDLIFFVTIFLQLFFLSNKKESSYIIN